NLFQGSCRESLFELRDPFGPVAAVILLSAVALLLRIARISAAAVKSGVIVICLPARSIFQGSCLARRPGLRVKSLAFQPMHQVTEAGLQIVCKIRVRRSHRDVYGPCAVD